MASIDPRVTLVATIILVLGCEAYAFQPPPTFLTPPGLRINPFLIQRRTPDPPNDNSEDHIREQFQDISQEPENNASPNLPQRLAPHGTVHNNAQLDRKPRPPPRHRGRRNRLPFLWGRMVNALYPYSQKPRYRYPYYDTEGNGKLLYGYGGKQLYRYSVFHPLNGYS